MRGAEDLPLLKAPLPELVHEVTGVVPDRASRHSMLKKAGVQSTQRLALCNDGGGGIAAFTWPAELVGQAEYLYDGHRAPRLLAAARGGGWAIDTRPHLAFWMSAAHERLYLNPTIGVDEYVARWAGPDGRWIGQHPMEIVRTRIWPWVLERGYASPEDEPELEPFIDRLRVRKDRPAYLRPGLRLLRRWDTEEVASLRAGGRLVGEIRAAVSELLRAVGDPPLPASTS